MCVTFQQNRWEERNVSNGLPTYIGKMMRLHLDDLPQGRIRRIEKFSLVLAELAVVGIRLTLNLVDHVMAHEILNNHAPVTSDDISNLLGGC